MASTDGKECYGKKFKVGDVWHWCCGVYDSFVEVDHYFKDGEICPICKRPVYTAAVEVDVRMKITQQICFRSDRCWLDFKDIIF